MEELLKDELGHLNLSGRVMKTEKFPRGGGGFGDIWRGRVDDVEVAIKIPKIYATHTERQTQKVAKEACMEIYTWSRLRHDNVLALLGYCFDFSTVSLISPWMANGSANDFLHANPDFPSVKLLPGITSGLCYMHDNQIVHGDLRGDNILISQDGTPRLADFGLSRELMQTLSQNPSKIAGAARWMAREYMGELNTPTKAGDVWAFGMTVLELATRKKPFHSYHNDATVILHITTGVTPSIPDASECCIGWDDELWKLCLDCWEPDPGHRPPMSSMKNRLLRFEGLESSSSEPQDQIALSIGSNPSIWPIPAFCLELEDLTVRVRATDIVYFASGGFSTVWRGAWVDPADGPPHKLALKAFLFSHLPQNRRNLEKRLKRETRLWRRLSHPHILPFLGVCYGPIPPVHDFPALISPLCENGNIVEYLSSRPEVNRISLLVQVASGLEYLHSSSVVHGDLRGSNILIKDDGEACLSDFGHSTLVASEEFDRGSGASGVQSASIRWSAPEKIKDDLDFESVPTLASDVWSFAMVILEVIDGRRPWAEIKSDLRVTLQLLQGKHPRRPVNTTISDEIWSLLERCWHPPDERPVFQTVLNDLRMIQLSYEMYH